MVEHLGAMPENGIFKSLYECKFLDAIGIQPKDERRKLVVLWQCSSKRDIRN
jgi:hypothetical protein